MGQEPGNEKRKRVQSASSKLHRDDLDRLRKLVPDIDAEILISEREASALTGIPTPTLRRHRMTGEGFRFVKLPTGTVRYYLADIIRCARESTRMPVAERFAGMKKSNGK